MLRWHLIKLVYATTSLIGQHQGPRFQGVVPALPRNRDGQTGSRARVTANVNPLNKQRNNKKLIKAQRTVFRCYLPLGATFVQAFNIWLLPKPGSPTIKTCGSALTLSDLVPPNNASNNPALTTSCP